MERLKTQANRVILLGCVLLCAGSLTAEARLLIGRDDAIRSIFGDSATTATRTIYLTEGERDTLQRRAQAPIERKRVTYYRVSVGDSLVGYAFVDRHIVRSLSETVLIALSTTGVVRAVEILAWNEPDDYRPSGRWLERAQGQTEPVEVRPGESMPNIAGSTLSARALTAAIRRAIALGEMILSPTSEN